MGTPPINQLDCPPGTCWGRQAVAGGLPSFPWSTSSCPLQPNNEEEENAWVTGSSRALRLFSASRFPFLSLSLFCSFSFFSLSSIFLPFFHSLLRFIVPGRWCPHQWPRAAWPSHPFPSARPAKPGPRSFREDDDERQGKERKKEKERKHIIKVR